jgi:hypothetical protein
MHLANGVADRDDSVGQDVRSQPAAMDGVFAQSGPRHQLQMQAWLAEFDAVA